MALAFYPLVAWLAYAARGRGQGLVRRPAPRAAPRRPPRGGPPSLRVIGSDVGLVRLGQRARGPS
jgi:hypothetical protein